MSMTVSPGRSGSPRIRPLRPQDTRIIEESFFTSQGGTDKAEVTARNAFGIPSTSRTGNGSSKPPTTSSGGMEPSSNVSVQDIAFHAGPANDWTIGIEHNTRSGTDKKLTAAQYLKSAELVLWRATNSALPRTGTPYPGTRRPIPRRHTRAARVAC